MLRTIFQTLFFATMLLHCLGIAQLAFSLSKNKTTVISMFNGTEEETKKNKESKEDIDPDKIFSFTDSSVNESAHFAAGSNPYFNSKSTIQHQFLLEFPTPPPDLRA
jgi:hypothetical protein